jgi:hypothetical protein
LFLEIRSHQSEPHNYDQPAKTYQQNEQTSGPTAKLSSTHKEDERSQEANWYNIFLDHPTEWPLTLFTGILALYTARLFIATSGLVEAAREQSSDMKKSIAAAQTAAKAAERSANLAEQALIAGQRALLRVCVSKAHDKKRRRERLYLQKYILFLTASGRRNKVSYAPSESERIDLK